MQAESEILNSDGVRLEEFADEKLGRESLVDRGAELDAVLGSVGLAWPTPDYVSFQCHFPVAAQESQADR